MTCPDHGPDVVCDREEKFTDAWGFPHKTELGKGQRAARHCPRCGVLFFRDGLRFRVVCRVRLPVCEGCA